MGKAADNELIKLKATFFNNLAVGGIVAGVIAPAFSIYQNFAFVDQLLQGHLTPLPENTITVAILALWFVVGAVFSRNLAHKIIEQLRD